MKFYFLLLIIILSSFTISLAQEKTLFKAWSGKNLEYIRIDSQFVYFEVGDNFEPQKRYYIVADTLRLYQIYTTSRDNYSKKHMDTYDFLIKKLTNNELTLIPLDSNARQISKNKKELKYIDRANVVDRNFKFNQIKYKVYGGAWEWEDISIFIDNQKNFKYINKSKRDKPEYYYGKLSEDVYIEFIKILESSEIDKIKSFKQHVYDVPETIIEINYNGKLKSIKQFLLPSITRELTLFLYNLLKKVRLIKTEPFEIKFQRES